MKREWQIGDTAYLKEPIRGYYFVEVVDFDCTRIIVRTTSGLEESFYTDEFDGMVD
jgi:hypothetical protein